MRHDDRRTLQPLDYVGRGKGLALSGYAEQGLVHEPVLDALNQCIDCLRLVAGGFELGLELELLGHKIIFLND